MKLRLQGNSVRLRLNQQEVAQFSKMGFYEDTIQFGSGARLSYSIEASFQLTSPQVAFKNGSIQIKIPNSLGMEWATTDQVGISAEQTIENDKSLSILIEKDFKCIHSDEHEPHAYPNPQEVS